MVFTNREEAAHLLAEKLSAYRGTDPLVLAIPRGAVPMGRIIADHINGELDVVLVRKLGAPGNPEYAIGAVDEHGFIFMNPEAGFSCDDPHVQEEEKEQMKTMQKRRKSYGRAAADPFGRIVIIVDDGLATGSTVLAAIRAMRAKHPKQIILAVAVAPPETVRRMEAEADEVICLEQPKNFYAVGQFFKDFRQVEDEEVISLLQNIGQKNK